MTKRYPGGYITKTPPTVSTSSAPGIWTMEQQAAYQKAGTWPFGGPFTYIEDVFSTYLYTGNGSTQTIINGIDLAGEGGLVWAKDRVSANSNTLYDTARGVRKTLYSNTTGAQVTEATNEGVYAFDTTGFSIGGGSNTSNGSGNSIVSWTFRKQPKFFDVVTYTGNGVAGRTVAHNLGSVPGCIIVKDTGNLSNWIVYHRSVGATKYLVLNGTGSTNTDSTYWNNTDPTSTVFTLGTEGNVNGNGKTYVAYLFAHNAGGFGLTGTDNVISCGSYTGNGSTSGPEINLGYEPQWIMIKNASATGYWRMFDNMRGMPVSGSGAALEANTSAAEAANDPAPIPTATGFKLATTNSNLNGNGNTMIYIAIRRGPMKTPTTGTSVFSPITTSSATGTVMTTGFPVSMQISGYRPGTDASNWSINDRLRGVSTTSTDSQVALITSSTAAETTGSNNQTRAWNNTGFTRPSWLGGVSSIYYNFQRAPGFFDEVCYTGTGVDGATFSHNLTVAPELMIVKLRSAATDNWFVYSAALGATKALYLNGTSAAATSPGFWNDTAPTSSVFSTYSAFTNQSGQTYVAYLFATCSGVSKVGSYTGTGTTLQIDCGFTGGARFVLIKRTDSTGDWYVWDSARGIVAGNDPYLLLNSTAAEVTGTDYVDTYSAGFEISSTAPAAINANGGSFIFLAIA